VVSTIVPRSAGAPSWSAGRLASGGPLGRWGDGLMSCSYSLGGRSPSSSCRRSWLEKLIHWSVSCSRCSKLSRRPASSSVLVGRDPGFGHRVVIGVAARSDRGGRCRARPGRTTEGAPCRRRLPTTRPVVRAVVPLRRRALQDHHRQQRESGSDRRSESPKRHRTPIGEGEEPLSRTRSHARALVRSIEGVRVRGRRRLVSGGRR